MSSTRKDPIWKFRPRLAGHPNVDGNIARLFNTGDSLPPPYFSSLVNREDETAVAAVIYGREGVANCLDASVAGQRGHGTLKLEFCFDEFEGDAARRYWDLLKLHELAGRSKTPGVDRRIELGLSERDCLTEGPEAPLRVLTVIESGGGGMPGGLDDPDSVLVRALMSVGEAQVRADAAGSYGYGKAAVAQASKVRVLLVYTCTPASAGSDGVTRRFMGVTYWGGHRISGVKYPGWGIFGLDNGGEVRTLEDSEADELASELGLAVRDPERPEDSGTTFVLLEPSFDARQLKGAIEVFWWPLLQGTRDVRLDVSIWDQDSKLEIEVGPDHELLGPFIKRFLDAEARRGETENIVETSRVVMDGDVGITSLSVKDPSSVLEGSLVAAMRSPLMVVSYDRVVKANPQVVGVFVAHESTNASLRRVEPPEHDKWHVKRVGGLIASVEDIRIAKKVRLEREAAFVALRGPEPKPVYGIDAFSKHFPGLGVDATRPDRPIKPRLRKQRLVHVNLVHYVGDESEDDARKVIRPTRETLADGSLRASAFVRFNLDRDRAEKVKREFLDATITIGSKIAEDGGAGDWHSASVEQRLNSGESLFVRVSPEGESPAVFSGRFRKGENIYFELTTDPYHPDWTVELFFDCSPWDVPVPVGAKKERD